MSCHLPPIARAAFDTPWGTFAVEATENAVTRLHFPGFVPGDFQADPIPSRILLRTQHQVLEYILHGRRTFTIPLDPGGNGFTRKVWDTLTLLDYGTITTYGRVAETAGSPGAARAVGMACRNNPIPLLIPCHRVIGANGRLTGFFGGGLDLKQRLIDLERRESGNFRGISA